MTNLAYYNDHGSKGDTLPDVGFGNEKSTTPFSSLYPANTRV